MIKSTNSYPAKALSEADLTRNKALTNIKTWDGYNLTWLNYANEVRTFLTDYKYENRDLCILFTLGVLIDTA